MTAERLTDAALALDASASPLAGAKWRFYQSGTLTPQNVYADDGLSTSLGAAVTADAGGKFVPIYFDAALRYRGVLKSADGTMTIHDIDPMNSGVLSVLSAPSGSSAIGIASGVTLADFFDGACYPDIFGIVDDPNHLNPALRIDQRMALQAWFTYAQTNRLTPRCHRPIRAYSSATLSYDPSALSGRNPEVDLGNLSLAVNASPGFVLGAATGVISGAKISLPNIWRSTLSWPSAAPTSRTGGVILINLQFCTVKLGFVHGFAVGHQYWSEGFGFSYNLFLGGLMQDCRVAEAIINVGADSFVNENTWMGGSVSLSSDTSSQTGTVVGTYFAFASGGYRGSNNNRWYGRSYELCEPVNHPGITEAIPVWFEGCGGHNYWNKCRVEAWNGPIMHVRGDVNGDANALAGLFNEFDAGLVGDIGSGTGKPYCRQVGGAYGNIVRAQEHSGVAHWHSGPLRDKLYSGGGGDAPRTVAPFVLREGIDATDRRQTTFPNRAQTNIHGQQWNNGGPFIHIDTSRHKDFEFIADTMPGNDGRWVFAAYDANMTLLGPTSTDTYATQRNIKFNGATFSTLYGNVYMTGSDGAQRVRVTVADDVKWLLAGPASGTNPMVVSGFGFKAFLKYADPDGAISLAGPMVRDMLFEGLDGQRTSTVNPATSGTHGFWTRGQIASNIASASGVPQGWICTRTGALGAAYANSMGLSVKGQVIIAGGNAYAVKTTGVTAGAGVGPSGTAPNTDYPDGTVVLNYIGPKAAFAALANIP